MSEPEAWLRGPLPGVDPYLMPAAHALIQAGEDLEAAASLTEEQLEARPGGVASVGYHLRHLAGSTERLLTYARGRSLTPEQLAVARQEASLAESRDAVSLIAGAREALAAALDVIRSTPRESLLEERRLGRLALPSTVLGLLFHIAEHASRHTGQLVTTARLVRAGLTVARD